MPTLIFQEPERLAAWAVRHIPFVHGSVGPCQAIGVAEGPEPDAELWAVVVFHDYQPNYSTIQCTTVAADKRAWTRGTIRAILHYPFMQLGVYKIWGVIPHTHAVALDFNRRLGLRQDGTLRHHFGKGTHAVVMSMLLPEYLKSRWYVDLSDRRAA